MTSCKILNEICQIACFEVAAERQVHKLRKAYFKAVLRQEISWFDEQQTGGLTSRLTEYYSITLPISTNCILNKFDSSDLERIREGIGDKMSLFIQFTSSFVAGFAIGFIYSWQMTLVMMVLVPFIVATGAWTARVRLKYCDIPKTPNAPHAFQVAMTRTQVEQQKYSVAGAIAEETLSSIRTVLANNGQKREIARYGNIIL